MNTIQGFHPQQRPMRQEGIKLVNSPPTINPSTPPSHYTSRGAGQGQIADTRAGPGYVRDSNHSHYTHTRKVAGEGEREESGLAIAGAMGRGQWRGEGS